MKLVENQYLREQILSRMKELNWKDSDLLRDAAERGMKIDAPRWTKYKKNQTGQITDDVLLWVATRLGIDINLRFGRPVLIGSEIKWTIQPYDEVEALRRLNEMFPKKDK